MARARFASLAFAAALTHAADAGYPTKPVRVISPFAAGGATGTVVRDVKLQIN